MSKCCNMIETCRLIEFCLNKLNLKRNIFLFIKLLTIFCAVFMSLLMFLYCKNINESIQTLFGE